MELHFTNTQISGTFAYQFLLLPYAPYYFSSFYLALSLNVLLV